MTNPKQGDMIRHRTKKMISAALARRFKGRPSWTILIEMFIGMGWLRAAVEKIGSSQWWSGNEIREFAADHQSETLPWFDPILNGLLRIDTAVVVAVVAGQIFAGLALLSGVRTRTGLFVGMTMNLVFVMIGAVNPSIFYLMMQAVLWLWLFENEVDRGTSIRSLNVLIFLAVILTIISVPFISSLDPGNVIEDPAAVLVTYGLSISTACFVARQRVLEQLATQTSHRQ